MSSNRTDSPTQASDEAALAANLDAEHPNAFDNAFFDPTFGDVDPFPGPWAKYRPAPHWSELDQPPYEAIAAAPETDCEAK